MKVVTAAEMRNIDRKAEEEYRIPSLLLMENAGIGIFREAVKMFSSLAGKRILVVCGKGNNGGDGFVAARHLAKAGAEVKVFLLYHVESLQGDALVNFRIIEKLGIKYYAVLHNNDLQKLKLALLTADVIIDAIYGTGFRGEMDPLVGETAKLINESAAPVIAVDLPSGLEADTGRTAGTCINALKTLTLGLPKLGLYLPPGSSYTGRIEVCDISLPPSLTASRELFRTLLDVEWCLPYFQPRPIDSHKGSCGRVLLVAGSEGMSGAVYLAAQAALTTGAGLVTAAVPRSILTTLAIKMTEVITCALPDREGKVIPEGLKAVLEAAQKASVLALGSGLGYGFEVQSFVRSLLAAVEVPLVIDADGLNALGASPDNWLPKNSMPVVLTPHPGEMARLLDITAEEVQKDRLGLTEQAAREWQAVVVLKGYRTVIACPDGRTFINTTGNPGLSTAGTGDILTGIISALIAQGLKAENAAAVGVFLHGLCGDRVVQDKGERALMATDLLWSLPKVIKEMEDAVSLDEEKL